MQINNKGFVWLPILLGILAVLVVSGGVYWYLQTHQQPGTPSLVGQITTSTNGQIVGYVSYPSSCTKAQKVCAVDNADSTKVFCSATTTSGCIEDNVDTSFSIMVPAGEYTVYSSLVSNPSWRVYYDEFVTCGESANCPVSSHLMHVPVRVVAGSTTPARPVDWYAYQGVPDSVSIGGGMSRLYSNFGFSLDYPSNLQATGTVSRIYGTDLLQVAMVGTAASGVNITVMGNTATCPTVTTGPGPDPVSPDSLVLINGVQFTKYKISDPAAGLLGLSNVYQSARNNQCFTIKAFYEGAEPSHYQGEQAQQIAAQNDAGLANVDAIARSFRFFPN